MVEENKQLDHSISRGQTFVRQMLVAEKRIYAFILTLVPHPSDAEDLLQETAALMWVKYNEQTNIRDFAAWGIRIAHYKILEFRKKQYRNKVSFTDETFDEILGGAISVNENLEERFEALQACLKKLDEQDRKLILLKHDTHVSTKSIAQSLNMTADSVYKAVPRIHDMLVRCVMRSLREQGVL